MPHKSRIQMTFVAALLATLLDQPVNAPPSLCLVRPGSMRVVDIACLAPREKMCDPVTGRGNGKPEAAIRGGSRNARRIHGD
jgi:hypothetical protein